MTVMEIKKQNKNAYNQFIDFSSLSIRLRLFCAKKLGNRIHCTFKFGFFVYLFFKSFFICTYMISSIPM